MPLSRMRQIRWEECVVRSMAKKEGIEDPIICHFDCRCGDIECLGTPIDSTPRRRKKKVIDR